MLSLQQEPLIQFKITTNSALPPQRYTVDKTMRPYNDCTPTRHARACRAHSCRPYTPAFTQYNRCGLILHTAGQFRHDQMRNRHTQDRPTDRPTRHNPDQPWPSTSSMSRIVTRMPLQAGHVRMHPASRAASHRARPICPTGQAWHGRAPLLSSEQTSRARGTQLSRALCQRGPTADGPQFTYTSRTQHQARAHARPRPSHIQRAD
jgi:hypothetical protein